MTPEEKARYEIDAQLKAPGWLVQDSVVVPDQTEVFFGRMLLPKTLVFAKDDSHAEDIVHICREVFGKGNERHQDRWSVSNNST